MILRCVQVAWEPLLEPYSFTLELEQSANEAATGKVESETRVQVDSAAILNVNITEGLVKVSSRGFSPSFFLCFLLLIPSPLNPSPAIRDLDASDLGD